MESVAVSRPSKEASLEKVGATEMKTERLEKATGKKEDEKKKKIGDLPDLKRKPDLVMPLPRDK